MQEAKISSDPGSADWIHDLEAGDSVRIVGKENVEGDTYARVHHDGVKGWMRETYELSSTKYYKLLSEKSIHIAVLSQYFDKDESNEITVNTYISNVSKSKSIETGRFTWRLYDRDGKSASTDRYDGNEIEVTFEGLFGSSIKPGQSTSPGFDIGYSPQGSCVELHEIQLRFSDGDSSTYSGSSLEKATKRAEDVRLEGECSS